MAQSLFSPSDPKHETRESESWYLGSNLNPQQVPAEWRIGVVSAGGKKNPDTPRALNALKDAGGGLADALEALNQILLCELPSAATSMHILAPHVMPARKSLRNP